MCLPSKHHGEQRLAPEELARLDANRGEEGVEWIMVNIEGKEGVELVKGKYRSEEGRRSMGIILSPA